MIKICDKHEKAVVLLSIIITLVALGGLIGTVYTTSSFGYIVVVIGMILSAILRSFTKLIPSK